MKIGIEGQRLFRKKKYGMDMVALELIRNLQLIDTENEYFIFVKPDEDNAVLSETPNFKIIQLEGGSYPIWEQIVLPRAAKKYGCDILHCTSNTAPIFSAIPLIITLHDIIYMESSYYKILKGSASLYQKFGNIYRKLIVPWVVNTSNTIVAISHFEKKRIAAFFFLKKNQRLATIYNGVSTPFKLISDESELRRVKEKYDLPNHFFFFLGNTDPRKNTIGTLKAFSEFLKQSKSDFKLVMLDYDRKVLEKLLVEIGEEKLLNSIVLTGYLISTDVPVIYSLSTIFLYPSLREGFGIPILEAMGCGVPVITSNTSSMPEIAGGAAHIVDPYKPEEITEGIVKILEDKEYNTTLIKKGLERKNSFSWKNMAFEYLKLYNEVGQKV